MPRYIIQIPMRGVDTYLVEADTEAEAIKKIQKGAAQHVEQIIEDTYYRDADITIEE